MSEHDEFIAPPTTPTNEEIAMVETQSLLTDESITSPRSEDVIVSTVEEAKEELVSTVEEAKEELVSTVEEAKEELVSTVEEAKEELVSTVEEAKDMVEETILSDIKTLTLMIQLIMVDSPTLSKYQMDILPIHKTVFEALLKDTMYFENVEGYLKRIISDDKIDAKDVPVIMLLLTELYERLNTLSLKDIDTAVCGDILKIVIEVAVREGIIPVTQNDIELMSCIFSIIDTSLRLIQTKNPLDKLEAVISDKNGLVACLARYMCSKKQEVV
jgi:hypothetical protein